MDLKSIACTLGLGCYRIFVAGTDCACCVGFRILTALAIFTILSMFNYMWVIWAFIGFILLSILLDFLMTFLNLDKQEEGNDDR